MASGFGGARRTLQNRIERGVMRFQDAVILVHLQHAPEGLLEHTRVEVIAVDEAGNESEPATLTFLLQ